GIPVFLLNSQTVAETVRAIRLIGKAIGEEKAATALAAQMESRVAAIRAKVETIPEASRPKVFHEMWDEPLMTSGPGTIMDDLIRLAGGVNVAADAKTLYPKYSLESLVAKNPDVIVYTFHNDIAQTTGKGWAGITAVKEGRVYQLTDDLVSRPGPRIIDGLEELARKLHPELFK
ncbi:MAG: ABC transporter substrate-binding protein, partial [Bacillota bacterium]